MSKSNDDDDETDGRPLLRLVRFRVDPKADVRGFTFRLQSSPTLHGEHWLDMQSDADVTFCVKVDDE